MTASFGDLPGWQETLDAIDRVHPRFRAHALRQMREVNENPNQGSADEGPQAEGSPRPPRREPRPAPTADKSAAADQRQTPPASNTPARREGTTAVAAPPATGTDDGEWGPPCTDEELAAYQTERTDWTATDG